MKGIRIYLKKMAVGWLLAGFLLSLILADAKLLGMGLQAYGQLLKAGCLKGLFLQIAFQVAYLFSLLGYLKEMLPLWEAKESSWLHLLSGCFTFALGFFLIVLCFNHFFLHLMSPLVVLAGILQLLLTAGLTGLLFTKRSDGGLVFVTSLTWNLGFLGVFGLSFWGIHPI